jgi:hypothetical protein
MAAKMNRAPAIIEPLRYAFVKGNFEADFDKE